ncbi:MAG TPA: DMT family transporter [Verrucomicrobiae bacterium]|jgi:drug/metabolite transporter (DMT)-like permease
MIQAFLATMSFALSTVCGHRAARLIGGIETNFWRLVIATLLLAGWAYGFGEGLSGDAFPVFIISGFVGIGIGDVALYSALPMLGSRLTVLLLQCLTTIFAIVMEWLWLGTRLTAGELACGAVILGGVAIALRPREYLHLRGKLAAGLTLTIVAAFGNALGLVLSRKAYAIAAAAGQQIDGGTAAYQRVLGGLLVSGIVLLVVKHRAVMGHVRAPSFSAHPAKEKWRRAWPWVLANAIFGMTVGVSLLQWALKTTPTGIVQSIVSISPLAVIPLARVTEGERPSRGALLGGVIAVAGTIALTWVHLKR